MTWNIEKSTAGFIFWSMWPTHRNLPKLRVFILFSQFKVSILGEIEDNHKDCPDILGSNVQPGGGLSNPVHPRFYDLQWLKHQQSINKLQLPAKNWTPCFSWITHWIFIIEHWNLLREMWILENHFPWIRYTYFWRKHYHISVATTLNWKWGFLRNPHWKSVFYPASEYQLS